MRNAIPVAASCVVALAALAVFAQALDVPAGCSLTAPATFSVLFATEAGNFTVMSVCCPLFFTLKPPPPPTTRVPSPSPTIAYVTDCPRTYFCILGRRETEQRAHRCRSVLLPCQVCWWGPSGGIVCSLPLGLWPCQPSHRDARCMHFPARSATTCEFA